MKSPTEQEVMCSRYDWMEHDIRVLEKEIVFLKEQLALMKEKQETFSERLEYADKVFRLIVNGLANNNPYEDKRDETD